MHGMHMRKSMRMRAMDEMVKEKPSGLEDMRKKKMQRNLEDTYRDLMPDDSAQGADENGMDDPQADDGMDDQMSSGDHVEEGFVSMPVSPEEKKMLIAYRRRQAMGEG